MSVSTALVCIASVPCVAQLEVSDLANLRNFFRLLPVRFGYLKTAARFGYLKDCCFGRRGFGSTPSAGPRWKPIDECTHQQHVASQQPGVRILRCWQQQLEVSVYYWLCVFVGFNVAQHSVGVLQASPPKSRSLSDREALLSLDPMNRCETSNDRCGLAILKHTNHYKG